MTHAQAHLRRPTIDLSSVAPTMPTTPASANHSLDSPHPMAQQPWPNHILLHQSYGEDHNQVANGIGQPTESNASSRSSTLMRPTSTDSEGPHQLLSSHDMSNASNLNGKEDTGSYPLQSQQGLQSYDYARYSVPQYQQSGEHDNYYVNNNIQAMPSTAQSSLGLQAQAYHSIPSYSQDGLGLQYQPSHNQDQFAQGSYEAKPASQPQQSGWNTQYLQHGVPDSMMYPGHA